MTTMTRVEAEDLAIVCLDLQARLLPALAAIEEVRLNVQRLGKAAGLLNVPFIVTEQDPEKLGETEPSIAALAGPPIIKATFSAWDASGFKTAIEGRGTVALAGCETHACVLQTAFDLLADGRRVLVVVDAVTSRTPISKEVALSNLAALGARSVTVEMLVFELLKSTKHPRFREISRLIK